MYFYKVYDIFCIKIYLRKSLRRAPRLSFGAREWLRQLERHPEEYVSFFMDLAPRAKLFDAIVVDTTLGQDSTL